jgi:hypothetical protein
MPKHDGAAAHLLACGPRSATARDTRSVAHHPCHLPVRQKGVQR